MQAFSAKTYTKPRIRPTVINSKSYYLKSFYA
jgi:hypothetical protein